MLYTFNNASDYWDNGILTLSMFGHIAQMSDESDAKQILTASPWRTGGDNRDAPVLCG